MRKDKKSDAIHIHDIFDEINKVKIKIKGKIMFVYDFT